MAAGHGPDSGDHPPTIPTDSVEKKSSVRARGEGKPVGSRRIFAPQFKLQVLDSYRQDADCRGNQRATARKYGIHRRQIQKWLQVEASLRTTVEVSPGSPESPQPAALNLCAARLLDDSTSVCQQPQSQPPRSHVSVTLFPSVKVEVAESSGEELDELEEEEGDLPLDLTCGGSESVAALSKRRSFSLQFKLAVLDAFHRDAACQGNQRATARRYGINRRQVQKWLVQESELRGEASGEGGLHRQRLGRAGETQEDWGWDLSLKKRPLEEVNNNPAHECKRPRLSSESEQVPLSVEPLCLVKEEKRVTSTVVCPCSCSPLVLPPCCVDWGHMYSVYHGLCKPHCPPGDYALDCPYDCFHPHHHYLGPPLPVLNLYRMTTAVSDCCWKVLREFSLRENTPSSIVHFGAGLSLDALTNGQLESSSKVTPLCSEEVKRRYQDTALVIFKEQQRLVKNAGYLKYGSNRRTLFYTNYGNAPVLVHASNKPAENNKVCTLL